MTKTIETLREEIVSAMFGKVWDIENAKVLYSEAYAMLPERLVEFVNPIHTGTVESVFANTTTHWAYSENSAEWHEWNSYIHVAYNIVNLIQGTLGLRD